MRTQKKVEKMRKALMRSNTRLLLTAVVIFQALAMLLIALKPETASLQPLVLAAAILIALLLVGRKEQKRSRVALVAKSTQTEFWRGVFAGAEAAAAEYNLELSIFGPDTEEDFETQNSLIAQAVENGADALVFSAIDFEGNAEAVDAAAAKGVKIVVIDSDVNSAAVQTYIGTDNYDAGGMAGQAALERRAGLLTVGLVNYDENSANGQLREKGAREMLERSGRAELCAVINTRAEADTACTDTVAMLNAHPEINTLLAFNEPTSVGAARALEQMGLGGAVTLVGFDSHVDTVDGLQNGVVDALIVQNTYAMGYLGVESAQKLLSSREELPDVVVTGTHIITRDNMFTTDGQRALFAFDQ